MQTRKSYASLWWIIALCAAPVIAAYVAYYWWHPAGHVNYGELLQPRTLPDSPLPQLDGTPFKLSALHGKWIYLVADSGSCDAYCFEKLVDIRQLRLGQGKDSVRIERVWLLTDATTPDPALLAQFKGTYVVRAAGSALLAALPAPSSVSDHIYVIDPLGNLMMRYPRSPNPRLMIKDITRLLRLSQWAS